MRHFHLAPAPLLQLIATLLLTPTLASPTDPELVQAGVSFNELFERQSCDGTLCGWNQQLCCGAGSACYTDSSNQAQCSSTAGGSVQQTTAAGGYWQYYTTVYTETDLVTRTSIYSSYMGGAATATATAAGAVPTADCDYSVNESNCGDICCASDQYCYTPGQCKANANGGSSGYYSSYMSTMYATTNSAGVPLRPTSSTLVIVTETNSPTTTVPFETPVATGANMTLTANEADNGGGLSGGAIAGIVIGTLLGLLLLGLLCFYCCVRGLWVALCGGRKRRRTTEVEEYERYSHHGGSGAAAGRTWYGARKPSRVERRPEHKERNTLLGVGAGLAGLWAILGLKRRHDRRNDEKYSEYSYGSDYYTSESESF